MKLRTPGLILALVSLLATGPASAAITGARSIPAQVTLVGSGSNLVSINWQITTTADHRSGVSSPFGAILDPATGAILQRVDTPLDALGPGPLALRELLTLDAATVRSWLDQGLSRVVLERNFVDPATGSSAAARVILVLRSSRLQSTRVAAPAELDVVTLRLEFGTGNNVEVIDLNESLRALLTVQYTGTGVLQGRWQVAEPESSEGLPVYRTLALVNTNLQTNQRSTLQSPSLPSARPGKYLLRFCVTAARDTDLNGDAQCPDADLVAVATYQVRQQGAVQAIGGISPDRQAVAAGTPFRWNPVAAATVYRLQIFEYPASDAEPEFVTGMLLPAGSGSTLLSDLVHNRLVTGRRYLWRVSAHDPDGRLVGQSSDATFVYGMGR